jgi:hypothetical protein
MDRQTEQLDSWDESSAILKVGGSQRVHEYVNR